MRTSLLTLTAITLAACTQPSEPSAPTAAKGAASQPPSAPQAAEAPKPKSTGPLAIGAAAPEADRELVGIDGEKHTIAGSAKEKGVLVIFTCNHCPWVKAWQDRTVSTANAFFDEGVGVIAINSNDPAANAEDGIEGMKARAEAKGMKYPYVVDEGSVVARAFGATKTPEVYLFDAEGELVYRGTIDDNAQKPDQVTKTYLKDALTALVAGEPIPVSTTKALGCGIKFQDAS